MHMYALHYGGISESHACQDCVWPIILDADLCTTCPGDQVLVVMTHQVQCNQNRRPKVFNRGALRFFMWGMNVCAGDLNAKTLFIYSISDFNLGALGALFGGYKPTKVQLWRRDAMYYSYI